MAAAVCYGISWANLRLGRTPDNKPYLENAPKDGPQWSLNISHHGDYVVLAGMSCVRFCLVGHTRAVFSSEILCARAAHPENTSGPCVQRRVCERSCVTQELPIRAHCSRPHAQCLPLSLSWLRTPQWQSLITLVRQKVLAWAHLDITGTTSARFSAALEVSDTCTRPRSRARARCGCGHHDGGAARGRHGAGIL